MKSEVERLARNKYQREQYKHNVSIRSDAISRANDTHKRKLKDKFAKLDPCKIESLAWYCKYYGTSVVDVSMHLNETRAKVYKWFKGDNRHVVENAVAEICK